MLGQVARHPRCSCALSAAVCRVFTNHPPSGHLSACGLAHVGSTVARMRDAYHEELEALTDSLVEMTRLVGGAVGRATQALIDADVQLADQVIASDETIDVLRLDIERRAFDVLARQQPVASDLRTLVATLRMVTDLERAGDLAQH